MAERDLPEGGHEGELVLRRLDAPELEEHRDVRREVQDPTRYAHGQGGHPVCGDAVGDHRHRRAPRSHPSTVAGRRLVAHRGDGGEPPLLLALPPPILRGEPRVHVVHRLHRGDAVFRQLGEDVKGGEVGGEDVGADIAEPPAARSGRGRHRHGDARPGQPPRHPTA